MKTRSKHRFILTIFIILFTLFIVFKIYLSIKTSNFRDYNARNISKIDRIIGPRENYSFIIVGNVRNSIDIFDKKLVPLINNSETDFVVFLGDQLIDGTNDKYGIFYDTLRKLNKPALITVGDTDVTDGGIKNFFKHIGPLTFFFIAGNTEFIFLDTSGNTSEAWQQSWVQDILNIHTNVRNRFVFMNRSPLKTDNKFLELKKKYYLEDTYKTFLTDSFTKSRISAVFSSNTGYYSMDILGGVNYISSGGGGGELLENNPNSFFHIIKINVNNGLVSYKIIKPKEKILSPGFTFLEYLWFRLLSWFYVYFFNILIILSVFFFIVYILYSKLNVRINYYPDAEKINKSKPLKIAMFTNNYLPFIGGVPISIFRLKKGLEAKGHKVLVFAPSYKTEERDTENGIIRCSPLFHYKKGDLIVPVSNIFSSSIRNEFKLFKPDVVHVHHPFWLGSVGKKLAKKFKVPVVFTYHTRLEQYNHYVPVFHHLAGGQIPHLIIKEFASACDAVIAPTKSAKRYLRNLGIGKLIIVQPTGIELEGYRSEIPKETDNELILFSVFRLSKEKNPYFLLNGLEKLSEQSSVPFKCLIAGTGPEEDSMAEYIKVHKLGKYVHMLGKVLPEEIPAYYSSADLFVFSSQSETQGMVILEAMAGGTPVVAVDSSGISDIVENGVNGYKTDADLDEWVDRVKYVLENKTEREVLGEKARLTAAANSIESMSENILDMYYEIIDWKKKHPYQTFIR